MRKMIQALAAVAVLGVGAVPAAEAFQLSITPDGGPVVSVGDSFTVSVRVDGLVAGAAPSLGAYDLDVQFDPSVHLLLMRFRSARGSM